jgi:DNA invertase Pin-like site-specific DNA recombinase
MYCEDREERDERLTSAIPMRDWFAQGVRDAVAVSEKRDVPPRFREPYEHGAGVGRSVKPDQVDIYLLRSDGMIEAAIADKLGMSDSQVKRCIRELVEIGALPPQ